MDRRSLNFRTLAALAALAFGALPAAGDDWPQFRGHHRDGISSETGLLAEWPEGGPRERWRRPIGEGYSAVSVAGERLYTLYAAEEGGKALEFAAAMNAADGSEIWRTAVGDKLDTEFGNGPRSTPAVDGDSVYVLGSKGEFAALATKDGAKRWSVQFAEAFDASVPNWGHATSPVVHGDVVIVAVGGREEGKSYAAFDKQSGEVAWTSGTAPRGIGYNSPLAVTVDGQRHFVLVGAGQVRAIDATGKEVWSHPFQPFESHGMPIHMPPDTFYVSGVGGEDEGAMVVRVTADGVEEVWKSRGMKNHFSSSLYHDGYIYGFDNATFKCISAATGETAWAKRGLGKGSLIYADGHLIVLSDRGKLLLVAAKPDAYEVRGSVQALEGRTWTAPALAGGNLYLRSHTELVSYDLNG